MPTLSGMGLYRMLMPLSRKHIDAARLVPVLNAYTAQKIGVHAVWPRTAHMRPKVRHVV